ncbi:MAG: hypothetical protein K2F99_00405, partial [Muribaculaceae bacterium]|nr:hypothetical protein [Muribaculaceae bacterium]
MCQNRILHVPLTTGKTEETALTVDTQGSQAYSYYSKIGPVSYYAGSTSNGTATGTNTYYVGYYVSGSTAKYDKTYYIGYYVSGTTYGYDSKVSSYTT